MYLTHKIVAIDKELVNKVFRMSLYKIIKGIERDISRCRKM